MSTRPLRASRQRCPSRDVACFLSLIALAGCSAPFTSTSSCGNEGHDCAIASGSVNQAGDDATDATTAGQLGSTTHQGGEGGQTSSAGSTSGGAQASSGGETGETLPVSCDDALKQDPSLPDGDVTIDPDGDGPVQAFDAHCDMTSDGGGWTQLGIGEYWQKNDLALGPDSVLPWPEVTALLRVSAHVFRAGDGERRLYLKDEGALIEKLSDPVGTNSAQAFLWRSTASTLMCAKSYAALTSNSMLTVTSKEISCEPLGFGKHTCGVAAGWILFHRNDTTNWSGQNPCAFPVAMGGTPLAPTAGALRPLWLR